MRPRNALGEGGEQAVQEPPARVLLLYADPAEVPNLIDCLTRQAYQVVSCPTSAPQESWMSDLQPDLVLLLPPADDVGLLHACEVVRDSTEQPLLVLSERNEELLIARALATHPTTATQRTCRASQKRFGVRTRTPRTNRSTGSETASAWRSASRGVWPQSGP